MQAGKIVLATTSAASQFRSALAQNAGENLSLDLAAQKLATVGQRVDVLIKSIQIISTEDLQWELWFWGRNTFNTADPDTNTFRGKWWFAVSGSRIAASGLYIYYVDGLLIPYQDLDQTTKLHMTLVNRSAAAKSADAAGALRVQLGLEITQGW